MTEEKTCMICHKKATTDYENCYFCLEHGPIASCLLGIINWTRDHPGYVHPDFPIDIRTPFKEYVFSFFEREEERIKSQNSKYENV